MNAGDVLDSAFERIYLVNLRERADRRGEMLSHLETIGLSLSRMVIFPAVRPIEQGPWPSIGAKGCFMSHLQILRSVAEDQAESVLILEDDAEISTAFIAHPDEVWDALRGSDWEYLHGGVVERDRRRTPPHITPCNPAVGIRGTHFVALRGKPISQAVEYLERMVERPAGSPDGGPMHVDGAYSWFRRDHPEIRSFTFVPSLAHQRASASNIAETKWYDRAPVARVVSAFARRLKNRVNR